MSLFISLEGGEFTGKTLLAKNLGNTLRGRDIPVLVSREPGGSPEGEEIRRRIFERQRAGASPEELAVLFNRARRLHIDQTLYPFWEAHPNGAAIADRYVDSTFVYQVLYGGLSVQRFIELHREYAGDLYPNLTFLLYFPEEVFERVMKERVACADEETARDTTGWDDEGFDAHLKRQRDYLKLPEIYEGLGISRRFSALDASAAPEEVVQRAMAVIEEFL